ncbi:MAG: ABC-2 family transporter protein [bacterium]
MGFKDFISERWQIIKINTVETFMLQLSSIFENWIVLITSFFFVIINILFINVLFTNVSTIATYTKDQMILFSLIGNLSFFINIAWSADNMASLIYGVNKGDLDLILSKPLPSLFYVTFRKIDIFLFVKGFVPGAIAYIVIIKWFSLNITFESCLAAIVIFIAGQIALNFFQFLCVIPVFFRGSAEQLMSLSWAFEYNLGRMIPLEGLDKFFRILFITLIPVMISTGLTTSVLLNKSDLLLSILFSIVVSIVFILIKILLWKFALKNYTSASS